jgi:transposase
MRTPGSAAELEARRRRAVPYFQERMPVTEIARLVGASVSSVKRWKRSWNEGGVEALAAKLHLGPTPKLSEDQKQDLVELLKSGPLQAGYTTELWTCARVAAMVQKRFRVSYHPDHLGRLLHELGFSPQKPQQVAREQDAAAIERWRQESWPRIKKRRVDVALPLLLSMKPGFACNR